MPLNKIDSKEIYSIDQLSNIQIALVEPMVIFLCWDLGAGKTTISKHILQKIVWIEEDICSPTYTYYNKYGNNYHFDLYRITNYDEFFAIGWEDIIDNNTGIILIEWPEIISKYYKSDITISLEKTENEDEREISITYHNT